MSRRVAKAPTRAGAPKSAPEAKFALGTRPTSIRGKTPGIAPKNTRDYGTKTPPATALQPGNPIGPSAPPAPGPTAPLLTGV